MTPPLKKAKHLMRKTFFAHSVLQCAEAPDGTSVIQVPDSASIKSEAGTNKWVGYSYGYTLNHHSSASMKLTTGMFTSLLRELTNSVRKKREFL